MFAKGPLQIRHAVVTMLDAFVATAQETAAKHGGAVSAEVMRSCGRGICPRSPRSWIAGPAPRS
jgi:hypothetical protein